MQQIADFLMSPWGKLVSALLLFVVVWVVKSPEKLKAMLDGRPMVKRALVLALGAMPASAFAMNGEQLNDIAVTLFTAVIGAMGINSLRPSKDKAKKVDAAKKDDDTKDDVADDENDTAKK